MASLTPVHWEAITPTMRELLQYIGRCPFAGRFYLAGGTGLALRLGHRRSVDLDFFSGVDEVAAKTRREILGALAPLAPQALEDIDGSLQLLASGLQASFFSYGYPLLEATAAVEGVLVATVTDIGLMKLDAVINRGTLKDFYDLYMIAQHVPIPQLLALSKQKYPYERDFELMALEGLVLFDAAETDPPPQLLIELPWEQVKRFFITEARALGRQWFSE